MNLIVLAGKYSIYKFRNDSVLPDWIYLSEFYSITKTSDELSVVAVQHNMIPEITGCSKDWRILKILGPLDFSLIGIIADISNILKEEEISIFIVSSYDTDYILVKQKDLKSGIQALANKDYNISIE
jgi:uncharacterized protein